MKDYFVKIFQFLHLPVLGSDIMFGQIGFYAEAIFVISAFLLVINLLLKYPRRDEVFTGWTTLLLIVVPASLIFFAIIWLIPEKVDRAWELIKPHM